MLYVILSRAMFSLLVGKRPARPIFCASGCAAAVLVRPFLAPERRCPAIGIFLRFILKGPGKPAGCPGPALSLLRTNQ